MTKVVLTVILTYLLTQTVSFNYQKHLNNAITKAKELYTKHFGKDKSWHFLGYDATEYPGTDENLRRINREKWEKYYECLIKQNQSLTNHGSIIPEAILAFEGESVTFQCKVCLSPSEYDQKDSVEWEWGSKESEFLEPLDYSGHILISPEEKSLMLYNLGVEHTGQYMCKLKGQPTAPYFLTVVTNTEPFKEVRHISLPHHQHPEPPWLINPEVVLDTIWSKWSPCSKCNIVGKKHRLGYCTIILLKNIQEFTTQEKNEVKRNLNKTENDVNNTEINENFTKEESSTEENDDIKYIKNINKIVPFSKIEMEILGIFKYGIPCRSHILPRHIRNFQEIHNRKSEIMTGFCKVKCPQSKVFVVKDKNGHILETANNSAGVYSFLQGVPNAEPAVERRIQYSDTDSKVTLKCPGNLNSDAPIQWQIGNKKIVPSLLSKETGGRIHVTIMERIKIKNAFLTDSNVYSCWQNEELAGTINLIVEKRMNLEFNHHIMLISIAVIMATFLYVAVKAYIGRKYVNT